MMRKIRGEQNMNYGLSELALQNDFKNYTTDDDMGLFTITSYGKEISTDCEEISTAKQESDRSSNQAVKKSIGSLNDGQNYAILTKEQLMAVCIDKDAVIESCVKSLREQFPKMIGKREIMDIYHCESDKALRILKLMFQMGYGNKIGKEYYVSQKSQEEFVKNMVGKEVYI